MLLAHEMAAYLLLCRLLENALQIPKTQNKAGFSTLNEIFLLIKGFLLTFLKTRSTLKNF